MRVSVKNVTKTFGATVTLRNISLEIEDQELFFLLGPSGCGKTTLLRLLAGFYQPDEGEIFFGPKRMNGVAPHHRNTGMVFQNYALWPHMTVHENVAYGLEVRSMGGAEREALVKQALATVRMENYADRTPNQLSGGQQQRVALARALVIKPDVLLLDEPLSNLDARLRLEMRDEIRRIHEETKITMVYVTHDQKESLSLADRMAVMKDGVIEQLGRPRSVYRCPRNRFVADFIGETNWIEGEILEVADGSIRVQTDVGQLASSLAKGAEMPHFVPGHKVSVGFRPEAVQLGASPTNSFGVIIRQVNYLGEIEQYVLSLPTGQTFKAFEQNPVEIRKPGGSLEVHIRPEDVFVLSH